MRIKLLAGFIGLFAVFVAIYVDKDSWKASETAEKMSTTNHAFEAPPAIVQGAVIAAGEPPDKNTKEAVNANTAGEPSSGIFYLMAEEKKLGHLPLSEIASYAAYDDETLVALMKSGDVGAAKQYVRNGASMSEHCVRGEIAIRYGLTADAIEYLYRCSKVDAVGSRRANPDFSKDAMLDALAIVEFATYRGDFSWSNYNDYNNGIMNLELSQADIQQVSRLAKAMFDNINAIREKEGLEPFKMRHRGQLLQEALKRAGDPSEFDAWKRHLLGIDDQDSLAADAG